MRKAAHIQHDRFYAGIHPEEYPRVSLDEKSSTGIEEEQQCHHCAYCWGDCSRNAVASPESAAQKHAANLKEALRGGRKTSRIPGKLLL